MALTLQLGPSLQLTALLCVLTLSVVIAWTGWSVRKHGWRKRSLRRYSYLLFAVLLSTRLVWCLACLLLQATSSVIDLPPGETDAPDQPSQQPAAMSYGQGVLRFPVVVVLGRICFCAHFCVFSMLVCGWADSTWMMMSGRRADPASSPL